MQRGRVSRSEKEALCFREENIQRKDKIGDPVRKYIHCLLRRERDGAEGKGQLRAPRGLASIASLCWCHCLR